MTDSRRPCPVAISEHPDPGVAAGEAIGSIQDQLDRPPDLLLVLTTGKHSQDLTRICTTARTLISANTVVGAAVHGLVAGGQMATGEAALALTALSLGGLEVIDCSLLSGHRQPVADSLAESNASRFGLVFGHPDHRAPAVVDVGPTPNSPSWRGLVVPTDQGHYPSLVVSGRRLGDRAVGVTMPADSAAVRASEGAVEIGMPLVVTGVRGNHMTALDGSPPRMILLSLAESDDSFVGGPSTQFPPLRIQRVHQPERPAVNIVKLDAISGAALLDSPLEDGEVVQLMRHDPLAAVADVAGALSSATFGRAEHGHDPPRPVNPWAFIVSSLPAGVAPTLARRAYLGLGGPGLLGALGPHHLSDPRSGWPRAAALVVR